MPKERGQPCPRVLEPSARTPRGHGCSRSFLNRPCGPLQRLAIANRCELRLVLTLPRVFKNNNARMAIVYLVRDRTPNSNRGILLAEVREKWRDTDGAERTTDFHAELERIIDS